MSVALRRAASQRLGGFTPTAVGFQNLWWAEGSEFAALGLSDGAAVTTWPDEKATADATQATAGKKPTYRATGGSNSKPCVEFDGGDRLTAAASMTSLTQPLTYVVVAAQTDTDRLKGTLLRAATNVLIDTEGATKKYRMYAGSNLASTSDPGTSWHLHTAYFNGASSVYESDGTSVASGAAGAQATNTTMEIGSDAGESRMLIGKIALAATFSGDARADGQWTNFEDWVETYYGITIA